MHYLITIRNTGNVKDFNRAFQFFRNAFVCIEYYKGKDHAHLLIKTNRYLSVFDFLGRWKCYLHIRRVRETKQDVERVRKYIRDHFVKRSEEVRKMDIGHVKVWVKRKENGKVVLTIQAPKWYDLSRNRMVISWTEEEFKEFLKYLVQETGITKIKVRKAKSTGYGTPKQGDSKPNTKQYKRKSGRSFAVKKGFDKAVKG